MNYEELLKSKEESLIRVVNLPIGILYKKQLDKKFVSVIDIHQRLLDNPDFSSALAKECEAVASINDAHQLHFMQGIFDGNMEMLTLEQGNFITFEQLLNDSPATVGRDNFIENVVSELLEFTSMLNSQGIYHVCFAPSNVFMRKGDSKPLLMSHGSFYTGLADASFFYADTKEYVAPEVLNGEEYDERCDVYSIGKFIEYLFTVTDMPLEYKKVVKKATQESPDDRYETVDKMIDALKNKHKMFQSIKKFVIALVLALIVVGAYFEFMPQVEPVEFVKPADKEQTDDLLDDDYEIPMEMGIGDTLPQLTEEQKAEMKKYEEKCKQIFRKQYEKEADRILSKIYNSDYMGSNEKKFMAGSQSTIQELMDAQVKLANEANLDQGTSQSIASEIIERITERKMAELSQHGIQKDAEE